MPVDLTPESVAQQLAQAGEPLSFATLCEQLGIDAKPDKHALTAVLDALSEKGEVLKNRRGHYGLSRQMDLVRGRVLGHADGYGFLRPEEGEGDVFLPPRQMEKVFPGDVVLARVGEPDRRGREQAAIVEVLERHTHSLVGRYCLEAGTGWVEPDNPQICHRVLVAQEERGGAQPGELVQVSIVQQPAKRTPPLARVEKVLGTTLNAEMRVDVAIVDFGLPQEFPGEVLSELRDVTRPQMQADCVDARDLPFVTIDGADAKDFDDAVYAKRKRGGWQLWVAIADVSRYVREGTALDREARERATSAYFPGRVVPMLPPVLSDDLCSLRPDEDRHALICEMTITAKGEISAAKFTPGLIRSRARLIYEEVAEVLDGQAAHPQRELLEELAGLYQCLLAARQRRGALDFEGREVRFEFDDAGQVQDLVPVERTIAHRLIEECMIAANVAAARHLRQAKLPCLNRIHAAPAADNLVDFRAFLGEWGLSLGGQQDPEPGDYQAVLEQVAGRPEAVIIQGVLLRALSQAVYSPALIGHFGLALPDYAHFTSPIRRYPDLIVHRALKHLASGGDRRDWPYGEDKLKALGEHCSERERRADKAGWSVIEALKCDYLAEHVGEEFVGEVAGVTHFGLFVELERVRASGLVHISALGRDYFHFEAPYHRLRGQRSGQVFRLGDQLRVRLTRADAQERKIDLEPLAHKPVVNVGRGGKTQSSQWREL